MSDKSERVTDGYCTVDQLGAGGVGVKIHALQVKDGEVDPGDHPDLVNAVCTLQLPRPYVKQDRSWEALVKMSDQGDLAGQPPLCEVCKATTGMPRGNQGGHEMKRYAIHAETQPVPNRRTGAVDRRFVFWHVVVVGTELDELGDLHAVCGAVVDPMPWRRPLRDWLALTPGMRCPACDKAVGKDLKAVTDQIGSPIWE